MVNFEHLALLKQGVEAWNQWRQANPDLSEPDLRGANLEGADLSWANLRRARLGEIVFAKVNLAEAKDQSINFR